jgi:hypothetical protein
MKICITYFTVIILLLSPIVSEAAPVGNVAKASVLKSVFLKRYFKDNYTSYRRHEERLSIEPYVEFEYDKIMDRKFATQAGDTEFSFTGTKLGAVIADKLILYVLLGAAAFEEEFQSMGSIVRMEAETDLAWGLGATVLAYERKLDSYFLGLDGAILRLGVDAKFRSVLADVDKVVIDGVGYDGRDSRFDSLTLDWTDWHIAAILSLQWDWFVPYIGVKYSDADTEARASLAGMVYEFTNADTTNKIGAVFGTDLLWQDKGFINVECRLIDEEAFSVGAGLKF